MNWRNGIEKDIDEVLQIPYIFVNATKIQSITLTAYKPVYIKGKLSGVLFTPISTTPLTQTIPTSDDGYQYILLGSAYSTTHFYLLPDHPIFEFKNGSFGLIGRDAKTVNGHTVNSNVPANAIFTDTNTWRGIQNNLTSDSTTDSLSAAQGKVLKGLVDGKAASSHTHTKSQITDFPSSLPANGGTADIARRVTSASSKANLWEDNEGGNLELVAPDGVHLMQMDIYDNTDFRMHFYDGSYRYTPAAFNFSTRKFDINGNANTATTATKLSTSAGSATQPVYFSSGRPVACTYTLEKSVPSIAVFTDTTYSVATSSANGLMSSSDKSKLDGISAGANKTIVDSVLSSASTNPVQNNVITAALASKSDSSHTHSSVNYATNAGNADTVDNMHAWNLSTLSANGDSHGTTYPMYCRFNVLGDNRFYIGVGGGYERSVAVGFSETSRIAYNASHADISTESSTTGAVRSVIIGTVEAAFSTILDWANASTGSLRSACIIGGNGFPSDAPISDEATLRLESDKTGSRKNVIWTRFGSGEPVIYQRCIFNGSWLDVWRKVK